MVVESKAELSRRLDATGLGDEARRFREEVRVRLRGEGRTRREAVAESWRLLAERFPLPDAQASPDAIPGPTEPIDLASTGDPTMTVLATASHEVTGWMARHGIQLDDSAKAEIVALTGTYWATGLVGHLPRLAG